ncbi:MAG: tRNA pseudouridine(38-40) synthase TruA [Demequinaceae bacterium]|nr:tRNA pseudouridine(38-40) synthase TruA [Demequinaceae bacterium]
MTTGTPDVRVRLDLSYDGTDFSGWAVQPRLRTVQGVVEEGLARIVRGHRPRLTVAGRTDAGVHASGQVAHLDLTASAWAALPGRSVRTPEAAFVDRLGGVLPGDVLVRRASLAPEGFDARFSAVERRYSYRVSDRPETRDPLTRRTVLWAKNPLDLALLTEASDALTGLRDFAAFCRSREGSTTIRTLLEFSWRREDRGPDAGLVVATVRADAFCHSMVRSLVGAVLAVGEGRRDLCWLMEVAESPRRTPRISVAAPHGLTLEEVVYPPDNEVASRAESTRARRALD